MESISKKTNQALISYIKPERRNMEYPLKSHYKTDALETCELCSKDISELWCNNCKIMMCSSCQTVHLQIPEYRRDQIVSLTDKNNEVMDQLNKEFSKIKLNIEIQIQNIKSIDDAMTKLQITQTDTLEDTSKLREKFLKHVNDSFDSLETRIIEYIKTNNGNLEKQKNILVEKTNELKTKLDDFEKVVAENSQKLAKMETHILEDARKWLEENRVEAVSVNETEIKIVEGKSGEGSVALELVGGEIKFNAISPDENNILQIMPKTFIKQNETSLQSCPWRLRLIKNQLWSCQAEHKIQIVDQDLKLQSTLSDHKWGRVYDVIDLTYDTLLLAGAHGLFHVETNGQEISRVDENSFSCLAIYCGDIYAYAYKAAILFKFNNSLEKISTIQLPFSGYEHVTLAIRNNKMYGCSLYKAKVRCLSPDGKNLKVFGKRGSDAAGELTGSFLCQDDLSETLLIADCNNHRMQVMDKNGHFNILSMRPPVLYPCGAVLTGNKMYVTSRGDCFKLSLYTCDE